MTSFVKKIGERNKILEELGLVGASRSELSGSMTPEFPTVADYIHRVSVPSAPSASGPPNSSMEQITVDGTKVKDKGQTALDPARSPSEEGQDIRFSIFTHRMYS